MGLMPSKGNRATGLSEMHPLFSLFHSHLTTNSGQQQVKPIPTDWDNYSDVYQTQGLYRDGGLDQAKTPSDSPW